MKYSKGIKTRGIHIQGILIRFLIQDETHGTRNQYNSSGV